MKPVGANAWMVYALMRYYWRSGNQTAHQDALEGAAWLATLQRPDGSLPGEVITSPGAGAPTEPNLSAWWAFQAAGYRTQADRLKTYLTEQAWDSSMGRFNSSGTSYPPRGRYEILLDNQTWGAAFLHAIGRDEDARRALSYARWTLLVDPPRGRYVWLRRIRPVLGVERRNLAVCCCARREQPILREPDDRPTGCRRWCAGFSRRLYRLQGVAHTHAWRRADVVALFRRNRWAVPPDPICFSANDTEVMRTITDDVPHWRCQMKQAIPVLLITSLFASMLVSPAKEMRSGEACTIPAVSRYRRLCDGLFGQRL